MQTHGKLVKWNDDRGFGFILPAQGDSELFVHISAFPRDARRPQVGELISFDTEIGSNGKLRAIRVRRAGGHAKTRQTLSGRSQPLLGRVIHALLVIAFVAAIGTYAYSRLERSSMIGESSDSILTKPGVAYSRVERSSVIGESSDSMLTKSGVQRDNYTCDGRTRCSQMTSCAEATYFLEHCPDTLMDGDDDGSPCESQWCGK